MPVKGVMLGCQKQGCQKQGSSTPLGICLSDLEGQAWLRQSSGHRLDLPEQRAEPPSLPQALLKQIC